MGSWKRRFLSLVPALFKCLFYFDYSNYGNISVEPLQSSIIIPFTIHHAETSVVDELFQTAFKKRTLFFLDLYRIDAHALV